MAQEEIVLQNRPGAPLFYYWTGFEASESFSQLADGVKIERQMENAL